MCLGIFFQLVIRTPVEVSIHIPAGSYQCGTKRNGRRSFEVQGRSILHDLNSKTARRRQGIEGRLHIERPASIICHVSNVRHLPHPCLHQLPAPQFILALAISLFLLNRLRSQRARSLLLLTAFFAPMTMPSNFSVFMIFPLLLPQLWFENHQEEGSQRGERGCCSPKIPTAKNAEKCGG